MNINLDGEFQYYNRLVDKKDNDQEINEFKIAIDEIVLKANLVERKNSMFAFLITYPEMLNRKNRKKRKCTFYKEILLPVLKKYISDIELIALKEDFSTEKLNAKDKNSNDSLEFLFFDFIEKENVDQKLNILNTWVNFGILSRDIHFIKKIVSVIKLLKDKEATLAPQLNIILSMNKILCQAILDNKVEEPKEFFSEYIKKKLLEKMKPLDLVIEAMNIASSAYGNMFPTISSFISLSQQSLQKYSNRTTSFSLAQEKVTRKKVLQEIVHILKDNAEPSSMKEITEANTQSLNKIRLQLDEIKNVKLIRHQEQENLELTLAILLDRSKTIGLVSEALGQDFEHSLTKLLSNSEIEESRNNKVNVEQSSFFVEYISKTLETMLQETKQFVEMQFLRVQKSLGGIERGIETNRQIMKEGFAFIRSDLNNLGKKVNSDLMLNEERLRTHFDNYKDSLTISFEEVLDAAKSGNYKLDEILARQQQTILSIETLAKKIQKNYCLLIEIKEHTQLIEEIADPKRQDLLLKELNTNRESMRALQGLIGNILPKNEIFDSDHFQLNKEALFDNTAKEYFRYYFKKNFFNLIRESIAIASGDKKASEETKEWLDLGASAVTSIPLPFASCVGLAFKVVCFLGCKIYDKYEKDKYKTIKNIEQQLFKLDEITDKLSNILVNRYSLAFENKTLPLTISSLHKLSNAATKLIIIYLIDKKLDVIYTKKQPAEFSETDFIETLFLGIVAGKSLSAFGHRKLGKINGEDFSAEGFYRHGGLIELKNQDSKFYKNAAKSRQKDKYAPRLALEGSAKNYNKSLEEEGFKAVNNTGKIKGLFAIFASHLKSKDTEEAKKKYFVEQYGFKLNAEAEVPVGYQTAVSLCEAQLVKNPDFLQGKNTTYLEDLFNLGISHPFKPAVSMNENKSVLSLRIRAQDFPIAQQLIEKISVECEDPVKHFQRKERGSNYIRAKAYYTLKLINLPEELQEHAQSLYEQQLLEPRAMTLEGHYYQLYASQKFLGKQLSSKKPEVRQTKKAEEVTACKKLGYD